MMLQRRCSRYRRYIAHGVWPLVALFLAVVASPCAADPVRVLAAVTLKPALDAIAVKYGDGKVVLMYGPSPMLAKQIEDGVEIVGTFPDNTHPPIVYPIAVLAQSHNPESMRFLDFLKSAPATAIFRDGLSLCVRGRKMW
jgi:ABC-type molybdate transport system substrate-binding protein